MVVSVEFGGGRVVQLTEVFSRSFDGGNKHLKELGGSNSVAPKNLSAPGCRMNWKFQDSLSDGIKYRIRYLSLQFYIRI